MSESQLQGPFPRLSSNRATDDERATVVNASDFATHHFASFTANDHDYRETHIDTRSSHACGYDNVSLAAIRDVIQRVAKHVVVLKLALGPAHDPALQMILSVFNVFGAPLLQKLIVHGSIGGHGQNVFLVLQRFTALQELELRHVRFSSAEYIEPFLVSTRTLTTLVLEDITTVTDSLLEVGPVLGAVGTAFQRGLQYNKTLQKTSFVSGGMFDNKTLQKASVVSGGMFDNKTLQKASVVSGGVFDFNVLQPCLVGIRNNRFVQELELDLRGILVRDTSILSAARELASATTAQKLTATGGLALAEMIKGLSTHFSNNVQEVRCLLRCEVGDCTYYTGILEAIIGPSQAWNGSDKELPPVFASRGVHNGLDRLSFKSQYLHDNFAGLCHMPISELVLSDCGLEPGDAPVLCEVIRDAPLRTLDLSKNRIGAVGVAEIIKAASPNPLIERFSVPQPQDDENSDISTCHESVATLLTRP